MRIEEFIELTNAHIIDGGNGKKILKISVVGYSEQMQQELESYAYNNKNEIVHLLFKLQFSETNVLFQKELERYYMLKKRFETYEKNAVLYRDNKIDEMPKKPAVNLVDEFAKLSTRAKAYLKADACCKYSNLKSRAIGEAYKKKILSYSDRTESEYQLMILEMDRQLKKVI